MTAVLLILWPIAELFVAIEVARAIGVLETIVLLILGWPLGLWALRAQGGAAWRRLNLALSERRTPTREVLDGALVLFGGLLLMIPGFITDVIGIAMLLPPTRALIRPLLVRNLFSRDRPSRHRVRRPAHALRRRLDGDRYRPTAAAVVSAGHTPTIRTLAFGDLSAGLWGCAWAAGETGVVIARTAAAGPSVIADATVIGGDVGEAWTVTAGDLALTAEPLGDALQFPALGGFDQLCRVSGRLRLGETDHAPECSAGARDSRRSTFPDSTRSGTSSGWFAPDEGVALTSLRPRGAKGHDRDTLAAVVFGEDGPRPVADPRLSSTYGRDGRLVHAGLELWLDAEGETQYPYRAAADAVGNWRPG